jgi:hypothetical protein
MKLVKFRDYLVPLVLSGEKNSTWRLLDDKNLSVDNEIALQEFGRDSSFATAKITKVVEKPFSELTQEDKRGHETFANDEDMYRTYSGYYDTSVGPSTIVKIIWFELI